MLKSLNRAVKKKKRKNKNEKKLGKIQVAWAGLIFTILLFIIGTSIAAGRFDFRVKQGEKGYLNSLALEKVVVRINEQLVKISEDIEDIEDEIKGAKKTKKKRLFIF